MSYFTHKKHMMLCSGGTKVNRVLEAVLEKIEKSAERSADITVLTDDHIVLVIVQPVIIFPLSERDQQLEDKPMDKTAIGY